MGPQAGLMVPRLTSRHEIPALKAAVRALENWQAGSLLDARVPVGFLGSVSRVAMGATKGCNPEASGPKGTAGRRGGNGEGLA